MVEPHCQRWQLPLSLSSKRWCFICDKVRWPMKNVMFYFLTPECGVSGYMDIIVFLQHHYSLTRKLLFSFYFKSKYISVYIYIYFQKQFFIGFIEVFCKCGGKLKFRLLLRDLIDSVIYIMFILEILSYISFLCVNLFFDSGKLPWCLNIEFLLQRCCHLYAAPISVCVVH